MKEKWDKIDEHFQYIHRNLDICCQDMCEGQLSRLKLEEIMELFCDDCLNRDTGEPMSVAAGIDSSNEEVKRFFGTFVEGLLMFSS